MSVRPPRGVVLLVVVGVLGVLTLLSVAFVTLAQLERRASRQRLYATKALLLARSGIEDAMARLSAGQDPDVPDSRYGGENWDASSDLQLSAFEAAQEIFHATGTATSADVESCPVRFALRPSFAARGGAMPKLLPVEERLRGYSGGLSGDECPQGNHYALKVEDESAKIDVNGGILDDVDRDNDGVPDHRDPDVRPTGAANDTGLGWNFQLARILDVLGQQAEVGIASLGSRVLQNRPLGGYRSITELQVSLGISRDLSPWLATSSWVDDGVIHPNAFPGESTLGSIGKVKRNRLPLLLETGGRPPVNLNAVTRPVLIALLQDLTGRSWEDPLTATSSISISASQATSVADLLIGRRPFGTWAEFEAFCDDLVPGTLNGMSGGAGGGGNQSGADLLKANFNPNTRSAKELPDQCLWKWVDKTDLQVWSTEGSLQPPGVFRIASLGRITDRGGRLLATGSATATIQVFAMLRQTSQDDFLAGRGPDNSPQSCLSLATDKPPLPIQRTFGAGASWNPMGGGQGLAAATYPCHPLACLAGKASRTDGRISLATVELMETSPAGGPFTFLHHFDNGWDAALGGSRARVNGPEASSVALQTDTAESMWPASGLEPSTLYPDGVHLQGQHAVAFSTSGNLPPPGLVPGFPAARSNYGALSYWVKPCLPVGMVTMVDVACVRRPMNTQVMVLGRRNPEQWGMIFENTDVVGDVQFERQAHAWGTPQGSGLVRMPGLRWRLVTARFDSNENVVGPDLSFASDGFPPSAWVDPGGGTYVNPPLDIKSSKDLFSAGTFLVIGPQPSADVPMGYGTAANQVLDEFAVVNFGDASGPAETACAAWALARYRDGRYYKGEGRFLSAPLAPAQSSCRLLRAWWTACLPSARCLELHTVGGVVPAAGTPRDSDPALDGRCRVDVDLLDAAGTLDTASGDPSMLGHLAPGVAISRLVPQFRYRVRLAVDLADPGGQPILESPVFDDITFAWQAGAGPRILAWD